MSKCYDNPEYDDTYSDIQNTWNQLKSEKETLEQIASKQFQKDFNDEVGKVLVQQLNKEIHLEDIFNDKKKEGIKKLIQEHKDGK